jgi:hypothetical protein
MFSTNLGSRWNSAIFTSFPFVVYRVAYVTSDFQTNSNPWKSKLNADLQYSAWNNMDCINRYLNSVSGAGDVVVVTSMTSAENHNSSLIFTFNRGDFATIVDWVCQSPQYNQTQKNYCWPGNLLPIASDWSIPVGVYLDDAIPATVQYCLAEDPLNMDDLCGLHFNTIILGIVCGMNFVKATAIWYTWAFLLRRKRKSLRQIAMNCINKVRHRLWKRKSLREMKSMERMKNLGRMKGLRVGNLERLKSLERMKSSTCRWSLLEMLSNRFYYNPMKTLKECVSRNRTIAYSTVSYAAASYATASYGAGTLGRPLDFRNGKAKSQCVGSKLHHQCNGG